MNQAALPKFFKPFMKPKQFKGLFGGRGSGKSHCFAALMILRAASEPGFRGVCIREIQKSITDSSKQLLEDKINEYGLASYFIILDNEIRTISGGKIIFRGMQNHNAKNIKSLEGMDVAWIEEAEALTQTSLDLLIPTIRKKDSEIWASWNPNKKTDAIDVFFRSQEDPDILVKKVNWVDNPWFPEELRRSMLRDEKRDPDKYQHTWMGEYWGVSSRRIFKNYTIGERVVPSNTKWFYGVDWGFSQDPTAVVRVCVLDENTLYIDSESYAYNTPMEGLPAVLAKVPGIANEPARADNSRPETIDYVRRHGYPKLRACTKGKGSVEDGITMIQGFDVVIHPNCVNLIEEFNEYSYAVDSDGTITRTPVDKYNHGIDGIRYAIEKIDRKTKTVPPPKVIPQKLGQPMRPKRRTASVGGWKTA